MFLTEVEDLDDLMVVEEEEEIVVAGKKRKLDEIDSEPSAKKLKMSDGAANNMDDELIVL